MCCVARHMTDEANLYRIVILSQRHCNLQIVSNIRLCVTGSEAVNGGGFIADSDDEVQAAAPAGRAGRRRPPGVTPRSGLPLNSQGTSQLTAKSWGAPQ